MGGLPRIDRLLLLLMVFYSGRAGERHGKVIANEAMASQSSREPLRERRVCEGLLQRASWRNYFVTIFSTSKRSIRTRSSKACNTV